MSIRFDSSLLLRCSTQMAGFVGRAAARKGQKPAEYLRQAVRSALLADGLNPEEDQQYALVKDGEFVQHNGHGPITTFRPASDARGEWLPIEDQDSASFDLAKHWRLKPLPLRIEGARVVRTFPIVDKSLEHA